MLESLFNKVKGLQAGNFVKKRLQHTCVPVELAKFLRTPTSKNIYKELLLTDNQGHGFPSLMQSKSYFPSICFPSLAPKRMKRRTKYYEINVCLLERKVLRNILRVFPKMVFFQINVFGA